MVSWVGTGEDGWLCHYPAHGDGGGGGRFKSTNEGRVEGIWVDDVFSYLIGKLTWSRVGGGSLTEIVKNFK